MSLAQVREQDLLHDKVVTDLAREAEQLHAALADFKKRAMADISDLVRMGAQKYGAKVGGDKGNLTLVSLAAVGLP